MLLKFPGKIIRCVVASALPVLVACGSPPPEDTSLESQALTANNGISFNGISFNGISFNGISFNGISFNGISFNGISFNGMSEGGLADPATRQVVQYLISCALPDGDKVSYDIAGQTYEFTGKLGLAPEWKDNACGPSCQRWVSACMMARVNAAQETKTISLRGAHQGLKVEPQEMQTFKHREATYFGNIFLPQPQVYACLSPGQTNIARICGDSLEGCALPVLGSCDDVCEGTGRHHSFRNCSNGNGGENDVFSEAITVFLPNQ